MSQLLGEQITALRRMSDLMEKVRLVLAREAFEPPIQFHSNGSKPYSVSNTNLLHIYKECETSHSKHSAVFVCRAG